MFYYEIITNLTTTTTKTTSGMNDLNLNRMINESSSSAMNNSLFSFFK